MSISAKRKIQIIRGILLEQSGALVGIAEEQPGYDIERDLKLAESLLLSARLILHGTESKCLQEVSQ